MPSKTTAKTHKGHNGPAAKPIRDTGRRVATKRTHTAASREEEKAMRAREKAERLAEAAARAAELAEEQRKKADEAKAKQAEPETGTENGNGRNDKVVHMNSAPSNDTQKSSPQADAGTTAQPSEQLEAQKFDPNDENDLERLNNEFKEFFDGIGQRYGIRFDGPAPRMTKRGFISVKMKGELGPKRNAVAPRANDAIGAAREAGRFFMYCEQIGLSRDIFNREIQFPNDPSVYIVAGLRGKTNSVVLRRKDNNDMFTMSPEDFKQALPQK